jgi:hypothetical protein
MRMTSKTTWLATVILLLSSAPARARQQSGVPACPLHEEHTRRMREQAEMKHRGNHAMGFDQDRTAHRFALTPRGGTIEVAVHDAKDHESLRLVREHLERIAGEFGRGVFTSPIATHGTVPPGVVVMKRRAKAIEYRYAATDAGGRVEIATSREDARRAIHEFLRFQIEEHRTGDSTEVQPGAR